MNSYQYPKTFKMMMKYSMVLLAMAMNAQLMAQQSSNVKWRDVLKQDSNWYASTEAIRIADNVLVYQHEIGGWQKNVDMADPLDVQAIAEIKKAQERNHVRTTIDNGATFTQIRYLAKVFEKSGDERFKAGFEKGIDYLLAAQYENGGWPQYYPVRKGYSEHITFNDGAMMGVMNLLREVADGQYPFMDPSRVELAQNAIDLGLQVILKTQIEVNGELTAWCAQHDQVTLAPAGARAYELASISGSESVGIVSYLMKIEDPSTEVIHSINGAIKWFEKVKITGIRLIKKENPSLAKGYDLIVGFDPVGATPIWARFYEIDTNYPMFVDRDGIVEYALSEIDYERRVGYSWMKGWAEKLLEKAYPKWCEKWGVDAEQSLD